MEPPTIPERHSSLRATYQQQELVVKHSRENLKRTRSELSSKPSEDITRKVRIVEYDSEIEEIKLQKYQLDLDKYVQKLDENTYRKSHRQANKDLVSKQELRWTQRQALRLSQEALGIVPKLTPDLGNAAFCAAHLALYKDPVTSKRSSNDQYALRKASIKYYGSDTDAPPGRLWCPLTRHYWLADEMVCAHIVPHRMGEEMAEYIFGEGKGTRLMRVENTLMLRRPVEKSFDKHAFVLVPVEGTDVSAPTLKICITNNDGLDRELGPNDATLRAYNQRTLLFKNNNRPAKRFLYYHFVVTLGLAKRDRVREWERIITEVPTGRPFATPGPYLRHSMLLALANNCGDLADDERVNLLGSPGKETFVAEKKLNKAEEEEMARRFLKHEKIGDEICVDDEEYEEGDDDEEGDDEDEEDEGRW